MNKGCKLFLEMYKDYTNLELGNPYTSLLIYQYVTLQRFRNQTLTFVTSELLFVLLCHLI
jgi:hypothetical protein